MMTIRIATDSTCDLPPEAIAEHRIEVIPLYINFREQSFRDGVDLTRREFYERLPEAHPLPTTAVPGPQVYQEAYLRLAQEGASEVLSIHIASSLSAAAETARAAAEAMTEIPVTVLDSRQLSLGMGFLVEKAASEAAKGRCMSEILAALEEQIRRTHVFAALDTLEYLRRSGRMSRALAGIGNLLRIKPILRMYDGVSSVVKVRTKGAAERRMIDWLTTLSPLKRVAMVHANAAQKAASLLDKVGHLLPPGAVPSTEITPVIGTHVGPGAVGFACLSAA
jgi:DegV family protein with EDD domain